MDKYNRIEIGSRHLNTAEDLMRKYTICHDEIQKLTEKMESIQNEMEYRIQELNSLRSEEESFYSELEKTHGPGFLDTQTLEWIKN